MKPLRTILITLFLAAGFAATASADIMNGDFETPGGVGWGTSAPATWTVSFPVAGGNPNGCARIQSPFGNSTGNAEILQTFLCGDAAIPGTCTIDLDYKLDQLDASNFTGHVHVLLDGVNVHTSPPGPTAGWIHVTVSTTCGAHVLQLQLAVDAGNNGWAASFDNVTNRCEPIVPVQPSTWGRIKSLIVS